MSYICEICGQSFKTSTGPTSARHIKSKKHLNAMSSSALSKPSQDIILIQDLLLFSLIHNFENLKFSKIISVFSSFGIKSEDTIKLIIRKLKDEDIMYKGQIDSDYEKILLKLVEIDKISYPLTMSIKEIVHIFKSLNFKFPKEYVDFFFNMSKKFPDFVAISSSKLGEQPDLITFKHIFIDKLTFHPKNRWK